MSFPVITVMSGLKNQNNNRNKVMKPDIRIVSGKKDLKLYGLLRDLPGTAYTPLSPTSSFSCLSVSNSLCVASQHLCIWRKMASPTPDTTRILGPQP